MQEAPEELRLLPRLVQPGQRLLLSSGSSAAAEAEAREAEVAAEVTTEGGDVELSNAFRPVGGGEARCLLRWVADN